MSDSRNKRILFILDVSKQTPTQLYIWKWYCTDNKLFSMLCLVLLEYVAFSFTRTNSTKMHQAANNQLYFHYFDLPMFNGNKTVVEFGLNSCASDEYASTKTSNASVHLTEHPQNAKFSMCNTKILITFNSFSTHSSDFDGRNSKIVRTVLNWNVIQSRTLWDYWLSTLRLHRHMLGILFNSPGKLLHRYRTLRVSNRSLI